jgi:tetratricopeptide (TPR) repeat protein
MPKISQTTVKNAAVAVAATSCSAAQAIQTALCGNSPVADLSAALGLGGFALLGNLLSGHLGDLWKQRLADRMANPQTVLRNHDLLRLSGDAAQLVLLTEAEKAPSESTRSGELPPQELIQQIAKTLADEWNDLADTPGWRDELLELSREGVVDWMRQNGVDWSRGSSMNVEFWKSLLRPVSARVAKESTDSAIDQDRIRTQADGLIDDLAKALVEKHATSVRELLKQDAGKKGEAFAGLVLILHAETLKSLSEIAEGQQSLADDLRLLLSEPAGQLTEVLADLSQLASSLAIGHESLLVSQKQLREDWQAAVTCWNEQHRSILHAIESVAQEQSAHREEDQRSHATTHEKIDALKSDGVRFESHNHIHLPDSTARPEPAPSSQKSAASDAEALAAVIRARDFDDSSTFIARTKELNRLRDWLLPSEADADSSTTRKKSRRTKKPPQVIVLTGPTGRGKSRLIDRFVVKDWLKHDQFRHPEAVRLRLNVVQDQSVPQHVDALLVQLAGKLRLDSAGASLEDRQRAIGKWLSQPGTLVVIENVDSSAATQAVAQVVSGLLQHSESVRFLLTSWSGSFGSAQEWQRLPVDALSPDEGLRLFRDEMSGRRFRECGEGPLRTLVDQLDGLPLGIYLAAKWLVVCDQVTPAGYWDLLMQRGMDLKVKGDQHPTLHAQFDLSLQVLGQELHASGADPQPLLTALHNLSHAPACGVGDRLGMEIAGLDANGYALLIEEARDLHLVDAFHPPATDWSFGRDPQARPTRRVVRVRPLFADWLRQHAENTDGLDRMSEWFLHRLPRPMRDDPRLDDRPGPWQDLQDERDALIDWLPRVPESRVFDTLRTGDDFAFSQGPGDAWTLLCDRAGMLARTDDQQSLHLKVLSHVAYHWAGQSDGDMDRARSLCEQKLKFEQSRPCRHEEGEAATTLGDVLNQTGFPDEARQQWNAALQAFQDAGSELDVAYVHGRLGSLLAAQGETDQALDIWRNLELPVYIDEGDEHQQAITQGQIADVLQDRGELDEALRIRREEQLPVYERLGDVRSKAVTQGQIADVLQARGELDEALRIRREEQLPVYERLGDVRLVAITKGMIADVLQDRGELDEALRIRREEQLPVYERLGATRDLLVGRAKLALILLARDAPGDRDEAAELLRQAHAAAEKMGIPEAARIRETQEWEGLEF